MVKPAIWATYQGLRGSAVEYVTRSGLAPDEGWIEFSTEHVPDATELKIKPPAAIPWGQRPGLRYPIDIEAFDVRTFTVGNAPADPGDAGKFLNLSAFGKLRLFSGDAGDALEWSEVYIHRDAAHDRGMISADGHRTVKLRLTDVRQYWADAGEAYGHINISKVDTKDEFDRRTVRRDGKAYPLSVVLPWLFFHLPGPPRVRDIGKAAGKLRAPKDIRLEHESAFPTLQRLFQEYALSLRRLPDGSFKLYRRDPAPIVQVAAVAVVTRQNTLEVPYLPAAVRVFGDYTRRNLVRTAAPVSRDTDGRPYPLFHVISRYTDTEYALSQMLLQDGRKFEKIKDPRVRRIAVEDWGKLYQIGTALGNDGTEFNPDIPILDPVIALTGTAKASFRQATGGGAGGPQLFRSKPASDAEADGTGNQEVRAIKPQVFGIPIGQRWLARDELLALLSGRIGKTEVEQRAEFAGASILSDLAAIRKSLEADRDRIADEIEKTKAQLDRLFRDESGQWKFDRSAARSKTRELTERLADLGEVLAEKLRELNGARESIQKLQKIIERTKRRKDLKEEDRFWVQLPFQELAPESYTINERLGLIHTREPVGVCIPSIALSPEHMRIAALPSLTIFYGVHHKTLTPADRYSMVLRRVDPFGIILADRPTGVWPEPAEISRGKQFPDKGSSFHCIPIEDPRIILYIDSRGVEFNGKLCDAAAERRGREYLSERFSQVQGAVITYEGWIRPPQDGNIDSVGYTHTGGKPLTQVAHSNKYHATVTDSPSKAAYTVSRDKSAFRGTVLRVGR